MSGPSGAALRLRRHEELATQTAAAECLPDPQADDVQPPTPHAARYSAADRVLSVAQEDRHRVKGVVASDVYVPAVDRIRDKGDPLGWGVGLGAQTDPFPISASRARSRGSVHRFGFPATGKTAGLVGRDQNPARRRRDVGPGAQGRRGTRWRDQRRITNVV
jgi:hypothetical protein